MANHPTLRDMEIVYHLRDINATLTDKWKEQFHNYPDTVKISRGDIFTGAPAVDAVVITANSFGFMDGGIGTRCIAHFGTQIQDRAQKVIVDKYLGELLVGKATIVPAFGPEGTVDKSKGRTQNNEGVPIKYLILAPTMRVPLNVAHTSNAYLAFRAVILAIRKHNSKLGVHPIDSVLVPGMGTAAGGMPEDRCAWQMLQAYETFALDNHAFRHVPEKLEEVCLDHKKMCQFHD